MALSISLRGNPISIMLAMAASSCVPMARAEGSLKLAAEGAAAGVRVAGTGALDAGAGAAGARAAGKAGALEGFTGAEGGFAEVEALAAAGATLG